MRLDSQTIMFVLAVVGFAHGVVLAWGASMVPRMRGPMLWSAAATSYALACAVLIVLADQPVPVRALLFNLLAIVSHGLWMLGTRRFLGRHDHEPLIVAFIALSMLSTLWFTLVEPDPSRRIATAAGGSSLMRAMLAVTLWRSAQGSFHWVARAAAICFGFEAAALFDHAVSGWQGLIAPLGSGDPYPRPLTWTVMLFGSLFGSPVMMLLGLSRLIDELRLSANQDSLTRLPNRRGFFARVAPLLAHAKRHSRTAAVLMLDIDRFKAVNDRFGHAVGDEVLRVMGRTLNETLRSADVSVRWGGEEFCVLLIGADGSGAHRSAGRLREAFARSCASMPELASFRVSVSVGIAYGSLAECSFEELQIAADRALYSAKAGGRDRAVAAGGPALLAEADDRAPAPSQPS